MSFDFSKFLAAMSAMLPAVGEAVVQLHPENATEALKIRTGTALISALAGAMQQQSDAPKP